MTNRKLTSLDKSADLKKYRDLVLACLDHHLENPEHKLKTADFDSDAYYQGLKVLTVENFEKGRLTRLKQWFRDMTEMPIETGDLKFNKYLQDRTGYDIDIFKDYFTRIDKVILKGKIVTDHQFYEINEMVGQLCQADPIYQTRIDELNRLLADYELRKTRKIKQSPQNR